MASVYQWISRARDEARKEVIHLSSLDLEAIFTSQQKLIKVPKS